MKGHYIFSALLGIGLLLQGCETLDYTPADQLTTKRSGGQSNMPIRRPSLCMLP